MNETELPEEPGEPEDTEESLWRRYETMLRTRLTAATGAAEARRESSRWYDSLFLVWERNRILPASVLVGALASRIVIYLVPLFALIVFSFGLYSDLADMSAGEAIRRAGMVSIFATAADEAHDLNDGIRWVALIGTTWAALYGANTLGRLVRRSTALIWGVPYQKAVRPLLVPFAVVLLTLVAWLITGLATAADEWTIQTLVGAAAFEVIAITIFWTLVSRILPRDPEATRWGDVLPGAIFVGCAVVALRVALVIYFAPTVDHLTARYGSIALGLILLTWSYWLGMIMVGSAEINAALFHSRQRRQTS